MCAQTNVAPVIIKRKKVVSADGHHGGAWKVAYADFVTAMMAFFMLMWLLNATTEKQRKGLADYFNPNVPINRISGGGDAMFGGNSVFEEETLARNGTGGMTPIRALDPNLQDQKMGAEQASADDAKFDKVEDLILGNGGESLVSDNTLKHVVTRQTDEGLVIEIFDLSNTPLFDGHKTAPRRVLLDLLRMIAGTIQIVENDIAIEAHLRSEPIVLANKLAWPLSGDRADKVRHLLEVFGVAPDRMKRVTGHADRELISRDPRSPRNNRIEIILLRSDQP